MVYNILNKKKTMKKLFALATAAFIFSFAASAQTDRATTAPAQGMERRHGKGDKGKMMKELNLTKEQQEQMKAQHKEMKAKFEALKAQDNITVKEMREKRKALKEEQKTRMEGILTADQKAKFAEMRKKRMEGRGEKGKGGKGSGHRKMKTEDSK